MDNKEAERLQRLCEDNCEPGTYNALNSVYANLRHGKKWNQVEAYFDDIIKKPYLVTKYTEDSLNQVVLPTFATNLLSMKKILSIFEELHPPGDPDSYEDGMILAIVSGDSTIVYHNISAGLQPPNTRTEQAESTKK